MSIFMYIYNWWPVTLILWRVATNKTAWETRNYFYAHIVSFVCLLLAEQLLVWMNSIKVGLLSTWRYLAHSFQAKSSLFLFVQI